MELGNSGGGGDLASMNLALGVESSICKDTYMHLSTLTSR
jgi:hypothetical protein